MPVSKWFSIAREGATTDGRKIQREWLEQMAETYDPKNYGARVNLEHIKGIHPESTFRAYGDVIELKTEERDGKLHLLARIDATDELVELHKKRQKIYSSMEIDYEFADTGKAYLVGLAMTDSPASLGTEILEFSSRAQNNPFASRKTRPENLFTVAIEADLEFTDETQRTNEPSLLDKVKAMFSNHQKDLDKHLGAFRKDLEQTLELFASKIKDLEESRQDASAFTELKTAHETLQQEFTQLKEQLDREPSPSTFRRKPAAGSVDAEQTDC